MSRDPAADLDSGLEVTHSSGIGSDGAASLPPDPDARGQGPSGQADGDRKALEAAKRAERIAEEAKEETRALRKQNQLLVETLVGNNRQSGEPPKPKDPPYSQAQLVEMQSNGEYEKFTMAIEENSRFLRERDREDVRQELSSEIDRRAAKDKIGAYLQQHFGVSNVSSEMRAAIQKETENVLAMAPQLDRQTAEVMAIGKVRDEALKGELELPDFREETKRNTAPAGAPDRPTGRAQMATIDWDAPNRGLPDYIVAELKQAKMGKVLKKGASQKQEANFQFVINEIVARRNHTKKKRAVFE